MKRLLWCNSVLMLLVVMGVCGHAFAATNTSITISSTGALVSGSGNITVAFSDSVGHTYSESVPYGPYSTPASIAAWLGAKFTSSYICPSAGNCTSGLGAKVITPGSGTVTFQLNNGANIGTVAITNPSAAFSVVPTVWPVNTTLTLTSSPNPAKYGSAITLTATVSPSSATGTVQFKDNGANLGSPVTLSGGKANYSTTALPAGNLTITAIYSGDGKNSSSLGSMQVAQQITAAQLTIIAQNEPQVPYGGPLLSFNYYVTVNGTTIDPPYTAIFSGFPVLTTTACVTITDDCTSLSYPGSTYPISADLSNVTVLNAANYSLQPPQDGTLTIVPNNTTVTIAGMNSIPYGTNYSGSAKVANPTNQLIPVCVGSQECVTFTLTDSAGITIDTDTQTTTLTSGSAKWSPNDEALLAPGVYSLSAQYQGDAYNNDGSGTGPMNVVLANTTTLVSVPGSATQPCQANAVDGKPNSYTVTVVSQSTGLFANGALPDTPTGSFQLNDLQPNQNSVSLGSGTFNAGIPVALQPASATYTFTNVVLSGAGTHTLSAQYGTLNDDNQLIGDSNYNGSDSNNTPGPAGSNANCTVEVSAATASLTGSDSPGPDDVAWSHSSGAPEITFSGSVSASSSSSASSALVTTRVSAEESVAAPTGTISLTDANGNYLGNCTLDSAGNCSFSFSSDQFSVPSDAQGNVSFSMTATYSGDSNYSSTTYPFSQTVDCETYQDENDEYDYEPLEDSSAFPPYWYTYWTEDRTTTTYNCLGTQVDQTTEEIDSGDSDCTVVTYELECDEYGDELENDEYRCLDGTGSSSVDAWTGWYYNYGDGCD